MLVYNGLKFILVASTLRKKKKCFPDQIIYILPISLPILIQWYISFPKWFLSTALAK